MKALIVLLLLGSPALAQEPVARVASLPPVTLPAPQAGRVIGSGLGTGHGSVQSSQAGSGRYKLKLDALDYAWAATIIGDRWSTHRALSRCSECYEAGLIKNGWAGMGLQFGMLGATKWLEHKYPNHSTAFRVFKGLMVGVGTVVVVHNLSKGN